MLNAVMTCTVAFCTRHAWGVILFAVILAALSGTYAVRQFSIDTNVNNLISRYLPWRKRELEYQAAFPQSQQLILVVVEAPTPEQTSAATRALTEDRHARKTNRRKPESAPKGGRFRQPFDLLAETTAIVKGIVLANSEISMTSNRPVTIFSIRMKS